MLTNTWTDSDQRRTVGSHYDYCLLRWEDDEGSTPPSPSPLKDFRRDYGNHRSRFDQRNQQPASRPDQHPWNADRPDGSLLVSYQS